MYDFIDVLSLKVISGNGAPGAVSFRREKYIPKGGPDGGDGGKGGDILFRVDRSLTSLFHLYSKKVIQAKDGGRGSGRKKHGRNAEPTIIPVPPGTVIKDSQGKMIRDLKTNGEEFLLLKGGGGGKGNWHFATPVRKSPRYAQPGLSGEAAVIQLEIKLIADIGLVGFPNAGKSTFMATVTQAKPKIADYPFTTLTPHLGMLELDLATRIIVADIPGIIEGAHRGRGIGIDFLRHIERSFALFFILDINDKHPYPTYQKLQFELNMFSHKMSKKNFLIGLSKVDTYPSDRVEQALRQFPIPLRHRVIPFSSLSGEGIPRIKTFCSDMASQRYSIDDDR